jgi:hypothetical protein
VFILCDQTLEPVGTCFVVSLTRLVTAYHNLSETKTIPPNWIVVESLERGRTGVQVTNRIEVIVVVTSMSSDWALVERTDGNMFDAADSIEPAT